METVLIALSEKTGGRYIINKKIGSGTFGHVYACEISGNPQNLIIKITESEGLKHEIRVLKQIKSQILNSSFTEIIDDGKLDQHTIEGLKLPKNYSEFVVMPRMGRSLFSE